MKKYIYLFTLLMLATHLLQAQTTCCPKFSLVTGMMPCPDSAKTDLGYPSGQQECKFSACKKTTQSYTIVPYISGYSYQWQVTGGTPASGNSNPIIINWGNGANGLIKIFITSADGKCKDTIIQPVCLKDAPTAGFTSAPNSPVCLNQPVQFTNTSVGAITYYWNFGDGNTSTAANPNHAFTTPGIYTIVLAVSNAPIDTSRPNGPINDIIKESCGCTDTIRKTILVRAESSIEITSDCKKMLCKGDTATYCTTASCSAYNWSVTGGRILGATNGKCISVVWDGSYPATVTLNGNCGGACSNSGTLNVPVLFPTMPIQGNTSVCQASTVSYSLPAMPGTFYNWTISGGTIIGSSINTNSITVQWSNTPGSYTINCNYKNPITGCSGVATTTVKVLPPYKINGLTEFCVGKPFSFTANGAGNWTIQPATGFTPSSFSAGNSISGTWNVAGNYVVTATPTTTANYCSYPASINVIVVDTPKINAIIGPTQVCPSTMNTYSISSNMNDGFYTWTVTGGVVLAYLGNHKDSITVKWDAVGPYTIAVQQTVMGCSSSKTTLLVNVFPPPTITSGPTTSCMDNTTTYTAAGTAPANGFNWTLSNALGTIVSGQGTNTITVLWHGTTSNNNTCTVTVQTCSGNDTRVVTIIPTPPVSISKAGSLCSTTGVTLTASVSNGLTYTWQHDNVNMPPPANTASITVQLSGIYKVTITNANGCVSTATIIVPKENFSLAASISTVDKVIWNCTETINAMLYATPAASGYCYQWYRKQDGVPGLGNPISGATTPNYTATGIGLFWCEVRLCNTSCVALTDTIKITKYGCTDGGTCDPNYTATIANTNCNPMSFTGTTTPAAAAGGVYWYFGDGDEGSGTTITHQYKDTGSYKVCAVFGASPYCRKDICKVVQVTIAANFSATVACDKVTFTNLCKAVLPITSYSWSFPGGTPSTWAGANPPFITYANGGSQTASVTISNGLCTLTYTDTFTTYSIAPTINIPSPICAKTLAPFSVTGNSPNTTYQWNFGDGFISNLQNTTHAYQTAGAYTITLIVTNANGCSKTITQPITVLPELQVNIGNDKSICPGGTTTLNATPSTFATYQWYLNGVAITGATAAAYTASVPGLYSVMLANGNGCTKLSNSINVFYSTMPIADIRSKNILCTGNLPFTINNAFNQSGVTYAWSATGPSTVNFSPATSYQTNLAIAGNVPGEYQIILTVTDNATQCISKDTVCVSVVQSPTVTVAAPTGNLCEGQSYTFTATASPSLNPNNYLYRWSNGAMGNVLTTGIPGAYQVTVTNPSGCKATAFAGVIKKRPDVSLFPVGCDTLCWTDTLRFPLPQLSTLYTVTWYDNDGTAIANVGSGAVLPLSNLQPGIHHLYATVAFPGSCADTTGLFDLYIKDCTLLPPCDNCTDLVESVLVESKGNTTNGPNSQISNQTITITILRPVKEVRISLSDLKYYWKDTTCKNCKVQMLERGCLFANTANQQLGTLLPDSLTGINLLQNAAVNTCNGELVWKNGTPLPPGTYSIPIQLSLPKPNKKSCVLVIDKLCFHITVIDDSCKTCDKIVCVNTKKEDCKCGYDNSWTNLYLVPKKPGIPKPTNQILCNSVLTNVVTNTPYTLSGLYHCEGNKCMSVKNEIAVFNQVNEIIYTRISSNLNETLVFPTAGMYSVSLMANCGTQKCICSFRINVTDGNCIDCVTTTTSTDTSSKTTYSKIDSLVNEIFPPDFNGEILVAKNDTVLYEKYVSYKHKVDEHTAFDLASVTKTFTAMAVLKLMEDNKLKIDDLVSKYIPAFPYPDITIKMLLSHRSGLEDYLKFMDESDWDKRNTLTNAALLDFIINNKNKVQIAQPDKVFDYSNTNFVLLAFIIENVSGQSYKAYLTNTFFKPLKMNDTYILDVENYQSATKSYYKTGKVYQLRYLDMIYGDKNIFSTVQDLKKWDNALRTGKIFKQSTLDLAYMPNTSAKAFTSKYAMGWKKITTANNREILYHNGWWAGNRCVLIRLLKENVVIAVLSNNNFTKIADVRKLCDLFGDYQMSNTQITGF
jgi:CubicO group peptidase (beta-lactamase class C family)